jgi:hypothetical protein
VTGPWRGRNKEAPWNRRNRRGTALASRRRIVRTGGISRAAIAALLAASCGSGSADRPPTLEIREPSGAVEVRAGDPFLVVYSDDDPDDVATTALFADRDGDPMTTADQVVIALGRPDGDGSVQAVPWSTAGVAGGVYRIFGRIGDEGTAFAAGTVFVNPPPTLDLLLPAADAIGEDAGGGPTARIRYVADDVESGTPVSLFADRDGDPATDADRIPIGIPRAHRGGLEVDALWTHGGVEPGDYAIVAVADDGLNPPVVAVSPGRVRILAPFVLPLGGSGVVDVDAYDDGAFVVVGNFRGNAVWRAGEPNEISVRAAGAYGLDDIYVARHDADGALLWVRTVSSTWLELGVGVAALADGSCVVAGNFKEPISFGDGVVLEPDSFSLVGACFLARYDPHGNLLWVKRIGGTVAVVDVAADPDGSCFVTGVAFAWTDGARVILGEDAPTGPVDRTFPARGGFVASYDEEGFPRWVSFLDTSFQGGVVPRVATVPGGGCLVAGDWQEDLEIGDELRFASQAPAPRAFVARLGADGRLLWGRTGEDVGSHQVYGLVALPDGSAVTWVYTTGAARFGLGEPAEQRPAQGNHLLRQGPGGDLAWARPAPSRLRRIFGARDGSVTVASDFGPTVIVDGTPWQSCSTWPFLSVFFATYEPDGELRGVRVDGCGSVVLKAAVALRDGTTLAIADSFRDFTASGVTIAAPEPVVAVRFRGAP